ncbi:hypothetical protein R0K04_23190, partial [Pseudoalteromonas sp. SIMBA_153]
MRKRFNKTKNKTESVPAAAYSSLMTLPAAPTLNLTALAQPTAQSHATASDKTQALTTQETAIAYVYITIAHKKITIEQTIGDKDTR